VTDFRVAADTEEVERWAREGAAVAARSKRLVEEAEAASQACASIVMRWDAIKEKALPEELSLALEEQRVACAAVLKRKSELLAYLVEAASRKEEEFTVGVGAQRAAMDALVGKLRAQFVEFRDASAAALRDVEAGFAAEREELVAAQKREVDSLFEARRGLETRLAEDRRAREEAHADELYATQQADLENYAKLKAKLSGDLSLLDQQLEGIKFTYLLNKGAWAGAPPSSPRARPTLSAHAPALCAHALARTQRTAEKLEYNFRVLSERDAATKAQLVSQKARLLRLRSKLGAMKQKFATSEMNALAKSGTLFRDFRHSVDALAHLQEKYHHFESADAAAYTAMVRGHEEEISLLLERLRSAQRVVSDQFLGGVVLGGGEGAGSGEEGGAGGAGAAAAPSPQPAVAEALAGTSSSEVQGSQAGGGEGGGGGHSPRFLRALLLLLLAELGSMLITTSLSAACERLVEQGKWEAARALKADAILRLLGADSPAAIASLVEHFHGALVACSGGSGGGGGEGGGVGDGEGSAASSPLPAGTDLESSLEGLGGEGAALVDGGSSPTAGGGGGGGGGAAYGLHVLRSDGFPVLPPRFNVVGELVKWLRVREEEGNAAATTALGRLAASGAGDHGKKMSKKDVAAVGRWMALTDAALPASTASVWAALLQGVGRYKAVLESRSATLSEIEGYAAANESMKRELAELLASPKATNLQVHPALTLRLGHATAGVVSTIAAAAMSGEIARRGTGAGGGGGPSGGGRGATGPLKATPARTQHPRRPGAPAVDIQVSGQHFL
jgi:hypothetical protein